MTTWRMPTMEEAQFFATGLELQVPGEIILQTIDPEIVAEALPELARRWEMHRSVRAHRFDLRAWFGKTPQQRMLMASERAYHGMCWFLMTENICQLTDHKLGKALKFLEAIEKKLAGKSGEQDLATRFWEEFTAQNQAAKKHGPGGSAPRVGLASLKSETPQ